MPLTTRGAKPAPAPPRHPQKSKFPPKKALPFQSRGMAHGLHKKRRAQQQPGRPQKIVARHRPPRPPPPVVTPHIPIPIVVTPPPVPDTPPKGCTFVLLNQSAHVTSDELTRWAAACERQLQEHLAVPPPFGYGIGGTVRASLDGVALPGEIVCLFTDNVKVRGAYGFHETSNDGVPDIVIYPSLELADGKSPSVTLSHELIEASVDPLLGAALQGDDNIFRAAEPGDPVENDTYEIDGAAMSNFALPSWFQPFPNVRKFDYLGLCARPYEIRPGGYCSQWDGAHWTDVTNGAIRPHKAWRRAEQQGHGAARKLRRAAMVEVPTLEEVKAAGYTAPGHAESIVAEQERRRAEILVGAPAQVVAQEAFTPPEEAAAPLVEEPLVEEPLVEEPLVEEPPAESLAPLAPPTSEPEPPPEPPAAETPPAPSASRRHKRRS